MEHGVSITTIDQVVTLFRETVAVYCENHTEAHKYTVWAKYGVT
jgi:hypothetical protein